MIDKRDIVEILKRMKEECLSNEGCSECEAAAVCYTLNDRIPAKWTNEEIMEVAHD